MQRLHDHLYPIIELQYYCRRLFDELIGIPTKLSISIDICVRIRQSNRTCIHTTWIKATLEITDPFPIVVESHDYHRRSFIRTSSIDSHETYSFLHC